MYIKAIKTRILEDRENLLSFLEESLNGEDLSDGDVLIISSKIVSISEGMLVNLKDIQASEEAIALSTEFGIDERLAQLIINEADKILGGVKKVIATIKNDILIPFAGIDTSNVPINYAVLWPKDPAETAEKVRRFFFEQREIKIGVIISDSHIIPLRAGTYGIALGIAGFRGVVDERGKKDLFNKEMKVTKWNLADNLASAANIVMGERENSSPIAIIRDAPITLSDEDPHILTNSLLMNEKECLWAQFIIN